MDLTVAALEVSPAPSLVSAVLQNTDTSALRPHDLLARATAMLAKAELQIREQQKRIRELEQLSLSDPLTGLLNRRGFDDALARVLANCRRHGGEGLLAYADLDGFKQVNDRCGHNAGDKVLKFVGELLRSCVRETDYIARLGGDEFAIIFTSVGAHASRPIMQKLRRALNAPTLTVGGFSIRVQASVGSERFGQNSDFDALIATADQAMYRAKHRRSSKAA